MQIDEVMKRVHMLEADHGPDGWPAIQMRDLTVLRCEILELRAKLNTQRAGVRAVVSASVALVCDPEWEPDSEEQEALEQALRDAGFVQQNTGDERP
jgi:hypothetical protein